MRRNDTYDPSEEFSTTSIFITPMLDMAFQLMTFFIMTYHPSALEGQFPITLAAGEGGNEAQAAPSAATPREATQVRPAITVVAKARDKGKLASVEINVAGEKSIIKEVLDEEPWKMFARVEVELYKQRKTAADDRIMIQGSPTLRWEESMHLMDSCRSTAQLGRLQREGKLAAALRDLAVEPDLAKELLAKVPRKLFPAVEMDIFRN
jgi:biopolymer transport protein ExbD